MVLLYIWMPRTPSHGFSVLLLFPISARCISNYSLQGFIAYLLITDRMSFFGRLDVGISSALKRVAAHIRVPFMIEVRGRHGLPVSLRVSHRVESGLQSIYRTCKEKSVPTRSSCKAM